MPTSTDLLSALRAELVARGLVRKPSAGGAGVPLHVEPLDGPPAPLEREAPEDHARLVATIMGGGELAAPAFEAGRRRVVITVHYRSVGTRGLMDGRALDDAIRKALVDRPDHGFGYTLADGTAAAVWVLQASVYGGLGPVSRDRDGSHERAAYVLEVLS